MSHVLIQNFEISLNGHHVMHGTVASNHFSFMIVVTIVNNLIFYQYIFGIFRAILDNMDYKSSLCSLSTRHFFYTFFIITCIIIQSQNMGYEFIHTSSILLSVSSYYICDIFLFFNMTGNLPGKATMTRMTGCPRRRMSS